MKHKFSKELVKNETGNEIIVSIDNLLINIMNEANVTFIQLKLKYFRFLQVKDALDEYMRSSKGYVSVDSTVTSGEGIFYMRYGITVNFIH